MSKHDCIDHLRFRESDHVETHGLECGPYEQCHQEWYECVICHEQFTSGEVDRLHADALAAEQRRKTA